MNALNNRLKHLEKRHLIPDIDITVEDGIRILFAVLATEGPEGWEDEDTKQAILLWKAGIGDADALHARLSKIAEPITERYRRQREQEEAERLKTRR